MKQLNISKGFIFIALLILIGGLLRLLPTPPNVAPIAAIALLGAAYINNRYLALFLPLIALLISDLVLQITFAAGIQPFKGFHPLMPFVYGGFILIVLAGRQLLKKITFPRLLGGSLAASLIFFIVTNFGVWLMGGGVIYTYSFGGLIATYIAAIPFFHYTLIGDLLFCGLFFGVFEAARAQFPAFEKVYIKK